MDEDRSRMIRRGGGLAEPDEDVGSFSQPLGALDTDGLHAVECIPHPRRVGESKRYAAERQRHLDMVAGGAWNVRDNRSLLPDYRIDKARFSGVHRTCDHDPYP